MMNGVSTVERQFKEKLANRTSSDFYLQNPHKWADEKLGLDLYERHTLAGAKWNGWGEHQISFLRDITDFEIKFVMGICNRGGSKTWLTAIGLTCILDNIPNIKANVLSGSFKQAKICYKYARDVFTRTSVADKVLRTTMDETELIGGGGLSVLAATENQTRAPRTDILVLEEACRIKNSLITSYLPQAITATNFKIIVLTTPNDLNHEVKRWWDIAEKLGLIRHHWGAPHCSWIPKENLEFMQNILDENDYRIEMLGEWGSAAGSVFNYSDIQATLCSVQDLPPLEEMDRFYMGIDWGMAHPTVAVVLGMRGNVAKGTDEWFVYYVQEWKNTDLDIIIHGGYKDITGGVFSLKDLEKQGMSPDLYEYQWGLLDIMNFYRPSVYSEQSPISVFPNRELTNYIMDYGITFRTDTFSKKKQAMVKNLRGTLEKNKMKIPRVYRNLVSQLIAYSYKVVNEEVREEFKKLNDDYVDATVWARWCIHPFEGRLVEIGELGDLYDE